MYLCFVFVQIILSFMVLFSCLDALIDYLGFYCRLM